MQGGYQCISCILLCSNHWRNCGDVCCPRVAIVCAALSTSQMTLGGSSASAHTALFVTATLLQCCLFAFDWPWRTHSMEEVLCFANDSF